MGCTNPCYSSAILKSSNIFYFFDSHSRDINGMCAPNGKATMTSHSGAKSLCDFIGKLALSLNLKDNVQSEISEIKICGETCFADDNFDSSFSGFSYMND